MNNSEWNYTVISIFWLGKTNISHFQIRLYRPLCRNYELGAFRHTQFLWPNMEVRHLHKHSMYPRKSILQIGILAYTSSYNELQLINFTARFRSIKDYEDSYMLMLAAVRLKLLHGITGIFQSSPAWHSKCHSSVLNLCATSQITTVIWAVVLFSSAL